MRAEAPFDWMKGSHRAPPKQYGLTTLSLAQSASHSSQNASPFPVSLLLLYELRNMTVIVGFETALVGFEIVLVDFEILLVDFEILLVDFEILLVDFDSNTYPLLLH